MLQGFQAGLSRIAILRKRGLFRQEFDGFRPARIAGWDEARLARALTNPGIPRHRGKIEAAIRAAAAWTESVTQDPGGFSGWNWSFVGWALIQTIRTAQGGLPMFNAASTAESTVLSAALKARGDSHCGRTPHWPSCRPTAWSITS